MTELFSFINQYRQISLALIILILPYFGKKIVKTKSFTNHKPLIPTLKWCNVILHQLSPTSWNYLTPRKVFKYGVFSVPYFLVFGLITEIYSLNLRIQSEYKKIRTRNYSVLDTFHPVEVSNEKKQVASKSGK